MAKRLTDTEKWNRPWFRELQAPYREFWGYLVDMCDASGVWYVDLKLAEFHIGQKVDRERALKLFEKQVTVLGDGTRWLIHGFAPFQYGKLKPKSNVHQSVLKILDRHGVDLALLYPTDRVGPTPKDKDKAKEKAKEKANA